MARPAAARTPWVLVVVLIAALAVGATASIIAAPQLAAPTSGPAPEVLLPTWVFVAAILGMLAIIIGLWIFLRVGSEGKGLSNRTFFSILFAIAIISLIIIGLRVLGVGGPPAQVTTGKGGGNTSLNATNTTPPTHVANLNGVGGYLSFPTLPPWLPFVLLGVVVLVAVAVGVPQARRFVLERREELRRRRPPADASTADMRAALSRASMALDLGDDPRSVILALYREMLAHLVPMVGDVATHTPEEIRANHLERLGVRAEAAHTLTRLFEEARYSTHPMGAKESARAQQALRATIDDLSPLRATIDDHDRRPAADRP